MQEHLEERFPPIEVRTDLITDSLTSFQNDLFTALGDDVTSHMTPPGVFFVSSEHRGTYDDRVLDSGHYYSTIDNQIIINLNDITRETNGDFEKKEGLIVAMRVAHEFGHYLQEQFDLPYDGIEGESLRSSQTKEDFCDYITGVFAAWLREQGTLSEANVAVISDSLLLIGCDVDYDDDTGAMSVDFSVTEKSPLGHNISTERARIFEEGYAYAREHGLAHAFAYARTHYVDS